MAEFRRIKTSLFLMLLLQFTASFRSPHFFVRDGGEVTLPCGNVIDGQDRCDRTTWLFSGSVELIRPGKDGERANVKPDRLNVSAKCSLVIKNVTAEDVGYYTCRRSRSRDAHVHLSLITMTEDEDADQVTLTCSLLTHGACDHTVKWLYEGNDVDKDRRTSQPKCSATATFPTSRLKQKLRELFTCEVKDGHSGTVHQFTFRPPSAGEDATTTTTTTTTTENRDKKSRRISVAANNDTPTPPQSSESKRWWLYVIAAVGLVALVIIIAVVIRWKRTKGNKTRTDENTADPEDGVSYASVSYTRKNNTKAQEQAQNEDEGEAVTYSSVKASSSSAAAASTDPSSLYATVNKLKK